MPIQSTGLAKRLQQLRVNQKISAAELAQSIGVTPAAIYMWEKKGSIPRKTTLDALANLLKVTKEFLLTGEDSNIKSFERSPSLIPYEERSLEDLMRAIEAKGFDVTVRLKTE